MRRVTLAARGMAIVLGIISVAVAQELTKENRGRGQIMLNVIKKELQKHYYDPEFHGRDLEACFQKARLDLDQATSLGHMFGIIAQAVLELEDSHTLFVPPRRVSKIQYGWEMRVVNETPYIIAVKPGSDAAAKGLKAGDAVLSVDGRPPTRQNLWLMRYRYYTIRPAAGISLVVQSPGGQPRSIEVLGRVRQGKRVLDLTEIEGEDIWDLVREAENAEKKDRAVDWGEHTILIWNLPSFLYAESTVKGSVGRLQKYKSVILDLRGNPGGYLESATSLLGNFIDRDIVVARPKSRKEKEKPIEAKTQGTKAFNGKLVVLVDSDTGSAAELFARVIQLEKRGTVIGDRTAGAVMQSRYHSLEMGGDQIISYGVYITEADLIMADGKSLEKIGVTPDEFAIPTAADLAAGRDPALSRAAAILGVLLSPEEAGKFFLRKWID